MVCYLLKGPAEREWLTEYVKGCRFVGEGTSKKVLRNWAPPIDLKSCDLRV